ncbi:MAG: histidine phosphatase family protein [Acidimicrobiia bacterium]|nr:histidine phosphatase family protein [Acidimicrobiia bacterium]
MPTEPSGLEADEPFGADRPAITLPLRAFRRRWPFYRCFRLPIPITTIFVVRHAEVGAGSNPSLSPAGQARAELLARKLTQEPLAAVYVTNYARTQQTGSPAAAAAGISVTQYPAGSTQVPVDAILNDHVGKRVLVVGHSNTIDDICAGLGVSGVDELGETQFDRMFIIHRFSGVAHLDRLRYGAETN